MSSSLVFPALLLVLSVFSWNAFSRRIAHDVAEWEMSQQQGRRYLFMYRSWSVAFAIIGVMLIILPHTNK